MAVPKIRFPGFTEDWEQRKLGEISERVRGNDGRMDLPTLTISAGNGWMNQEDRFSGNIAGTEQKNYTLLKKGQLSYNHGNSKLAKYGAVFELRTYEEALVPRVYHSFKTTNEADPAFIEYLFASKLPDIELSKLISSGARMNGLLNINYDQFMGISIKLPAVEEQIRIGQFFRNVDYAITLHQRKLESMKLLKKSLLQKMFPKSGETVPEVRFPGFTDAWEQRKFAELANIRRGLTYKPNDVTDSGIRVLRSSNINEDSFIENDDDVFVKESAVNISSVKDGDILITSANGSNRLVGKHAIIFKAGQAVHGGFMLIASAYGNPYFLNASMSSSWYTNFVNMYVAGGNGAIGNLKKSDLENQVIRVPSEAEQLRIGQFFQSLDQTITLHQRKVEILHKLKKSLLRQMFV